MIGDAFRVCVFVCNSSSRGNEDGALRLPQRVDLLTMLFHLDITGRSERLAGRRLPGPGRRSLVQSRYLVHPTWRHAKGVLASRDDAGTSALLPGPRLLWRFRASRRDPGWKETDNGRQGACARDGEMSCRRCDTALASDRQVHHRRPHGAPASSMRSTCWPSGTSSTDSLSCAYPMPSRCWRYAIGVLGWLRYK